MGVKCQVIIKIEKSECQQFCVYSIFIIPTALCSFFMFNYFGTISYVIGSPVQEQSSPLQQVWNPNCTYIV